MFRKKKITTEIFIEGMHCMHCAKAVTEMLKKLDGVSSVNVILEEKKAIVISKSTLDAEAVKNAVSDAGFTVINIA